MKQRKIQKYSTSYTKEVSIASLGHAVSSRPALLALLKRSKSYTKKMNTTSQQHAALAKAITES